MRPTRKLRRDAKHLFRLCVTDGVLDDARARRAVTAVSRATTRNRLALLAQFRRLVQLDRARHTATVESAVPLSDAVRSTLETQLDRTHGPGLITTFAVRPELLARVRIRVASAVFDGTVRGALEALEARL